MSRDFDDYRHTYRDEVQRSIAFSGQDVGFFTDVKARLLCELAQRTFGEIGALSVLDVGCGVGLTDDALKGRFGHINGVDVSEGAVAEAAAANPWADYASYDGRSLPFEEGRFDLAFAICVLHHVEPPDRPAFVTEVARVVRPGGLVVVIEHNPMNPLTRMAVARCDFDEGVELAPGKEARALFASRGLQPVEHRYILFFPLRGSAPRWVERWLTWLPFGAQYIVAGRKAGG
jgi:SAM-dependent methyltransferase